MRSTRAADARPADAGMAATLPAEAVGIEFTIHCYVLIGVVLPFNTIILPAFSWTILTTVWPGSALELAKSAHLPTGFLEALSDAAASLWSGMLIAVPILAFAVYRGGSATRAKLAQDAFAPDSRYKRVQTQWAATPLLALVDELWAKLPRTTGAAPITVWFANLGVVARALSSHEGPCIAVSAGLWERIVKGDPLARVVLLHEMAHLAFRDLRTIAIFEGIAEASRVVLATLFRAVGITLVWLALVEIMQGALTGRPSIVIVGRVIGLLIVGGIVGGLAPLLLLLIRRYLGFLISLLELRADVVAAMWVGGLDRFASAFAHDTTIHQTTAVERARSLFSTTLTHLPESERLDLLRDPARLMTPKLQYFAMSLVYPFILPLTGFIGYILGGLFAFISVVVAAAAAAATSVLMLSLYVRYAARLPGQRLIVVSAALIVFMAATQIRLDAINYFIVSTIASFTFDGSPGADTASASQFWSDLLATASDIAGQVGLIANRGWIVGSWIVTALALSAIGVLGSRLTILRSRGRPLFFVFIACVVIVATYLDGYSEWRGADYLLAGPAKAWSVITDALPFLRLALAPLAVSVAFLIAFTCQWIATSRTSRSRDASSGGRAIDITHGC